MNPDDTLWSTAALDAHARAADPAVREWARGRRAALAELARDDLRFEADELPPAVDDPAPAPFDDEPLARQFTRACGVPAARFAARADAVVARWTLLPPDAPERAAVSDALRALLPD
ncbi:MAG: hypothetical protein JWM10_215, partial [Myxococcaceae bacterium]|nr:hypothetical protein [Myxococcaceae bacterium]